MKRLIVFLASCALLIGGAALARQQEGSDVWNGSQINWRDIRAGIYEASQTGQPVILVFHATWCPSCKKYRAVFYDPRVVEASRDFVMILIDTDADKATNDAFSPDGSYVPRTIFLDARGRVQPQYHGSDPQYPHSLDIERPDELLSLMQKAREGAARAAPRTPAPDQGI